MKRPGTRIAALVAVLLLLSAGCRGTEPPRRRGPSFASEAQFKAGDIRAVNPADRPEAQQKAAEEGQRVISLLNGFYTAGFVNRGKWAGGSHPELAQFFTSEAAPHIGPNLGALALADLAPKLRGVNPTKQDAVRMSFFVEDDLSVPFGVVSAVFEARAAPARGGRAVAITHNATFSVSREGDSYKIHSYTAELKAEEQTRSAAFGEPPGGFSG